MKRTSPANIRTILANRRTFLSFLRTFFAFIIGGLVLIHYFQGFDTLYAYLGILFIVSGTVILCFGIFTTLRISRRTQEVYENPDDPP